MTNTFKEIDVKKCLNCGAPVTDRNFLYDNPNFCSDQCRDAYQRKKK